MVSSVDTNGNATTYLPHRARSAGAFGIRLDAAYGWSAADAQSDLHAPVWQRTHGTRTLVRTPCRWLGVFGALRDDQPRSRTELLPPHTHRLSYSLRRDRRASDQAVLRSSITRTSAPFPEPSRFHRAYG